MRASPASMHDPDELRVRKFDLNRIPLNRIITIIGNSGSGKSHCIKHLMHHMRHIPFAVCISPSESADPLYSKFVSPLFIYDKFSDEKIQDIIAVQKRKFKRVRAMETDMEYLKKHGRIEEYKQMAVKLKKAEHDSSMLLVLDDCAFSRDFAKSEGLREISMNGRHWGITTIIALQYLYGILPAVRAQIGLGIVCKDTNLQNRRRIFDVFGGMMSWSMFNKIIDSCTNNYDVCVFDKTEKTGKPENYIFHWRAPSHTPDFRIGGSALWRMHANMYDPNHDERLERERLEKKQRGQVRKV